MQSRICYGMQLVNFLKFVILQVVLNHFYLKNVCVHVCFKGCAALLCHRF